MNKGIGSSQNAPKIFLSGVTSEFEKWIDMARERIFSMAAGDRAGVVAPHIMTVGLAKVLYAAEQMGADIDAAKPYALFAPDGTCSYNIVRTRRGFSYGCILDMGFEGLMATNNSMPNGCGFSIYELDDPPNDRTLIEFLRIAQKQLGEDRLSQLATGNHFAGVYYVLDPITGEDTNRRFVVVHCSGHTGGDKLYHTDTWLKETDGYHTVETPHGPIVFLEGDAKHQYMDQYAWVETNNENNRSVTMEEIFSNMSWHVLEHITHQGVIPNTTMHRIGVQIHDTMVPIAFNPEEGLVAAQVKPNLTSEFIGHWDQGARVEELGLKEKFTGLDFTPHGGGYEFKHPIEKMEIQLDSQGIAGFDVVLQGVEQEFNITHFKQMRHMMTFRRKLPVMRELFRADLADIVFEMPTLIQICPPKSIPGGSH